MNNNYKSFELYRGDNQAELLIEGTASDGVKRIANTVCRDISLVTGVLQNPINSLDDVKGKYVIVAGTNGESHILSGLAEQSKLNVTKILGKRECYQMQVVDNPFSNYPGIEKALVICGSDKRGTIYGLFHLSEMCGISPLIFWGDVAPQKKEEIVLTFEDVVVTKEPSVRYRGFFINDEWPAFGNWCEEHYGDVNAKAYDKIFELVLRLKGNYFWPAMWNSSFWEDGPGLDNAKLADEYSVIMGTSHHEPLCRAGVEWQRQYKQYGKDNAWSFVSNSDAISEFWRNGLKRSKAYENVITIGMRGENDSLLLGEDASIQDNIDVVKKAIRAQNQLIREEVDENLDKVPRMLAIYKEVEDFYFGNEEYDGLREFDEIEDVILLLSDDNYGMLRAIPQKEDKPHKGGYGMYYHFDYHGAPFSYEWLGNSTLEKTWEQMTMAYEHDVREMWIVNVGDIKGNEYPLNYFMELAYDYDKWGISNINSAAEFAAKWVDVQFSSASAEQKERIQEVLCEYTRLTSMRIPESLNETVYQNNYHELDCMKKRVQNVDVMTRRLQEQLPNELITQYESMVYYPVKASLNVILLNLNAALNRNLAERGVLAANHLIPEIETNIQLDRIFIDEFHKAFDGKWNHMMDSAHTGFRNWDDKDWTYPQPQTVYPIPFGKITVAFRGDSSYHLGSHWQDTRRLCNEEMMRPDVNEILLELDSRGNVDFHYEVKCENDWLSFSQMSGDSCLEKCSRTSIVIRCDRSKFEGVQTAVVHVEVSFDNGTKTWSDIEIKALNCNLNEYKGAFLETEDYICVGAHKFINNVLVNDMGWKAVPKVGRTSDVIKAFPVTKNWSTEEERPYTEYRIVASDAADYELLFYMPPRNPMVKHGTLQFSYCINESKAITVDVVSQDYFTEWQNAQWNHGVTDNIRVVSENIVLKKGINTIKVYAGDANVLIEKMVFHKAEKPLKKTYLAPRESYQVQ